MSLSGGQRQRLALARAVLARPKILVLDDTLSALDVHTEELVEEALRRVLANATGIVVAHRASTVLLADKVALLQDGTITHVGAHSELLATVPAYRDLLAAEAEEELAAPSRTRRSRREHASPAGRPTVVPPSEDRTRLAGRRRRRPLRRADRRRSPVLLRARSRRLLGDLLRPHRKLAVGAASWWCWSRTPPGCRSRTWSRRASTAASRRSGTAGTPRCCSRSSAIVLGATRGAGGHPADLPGAVRADRPGHAASSSAAGCSATSRS